MATETTKKGWLTPEVKKQIAHIVSYTVAAILVGVINMTGEPNEEYQLTRVTHPKTETVTQAPQVKASEEQHY